MESSQDDELIQDDQGGEIQPEASPEFQAGNHERFNALLVKTSLVLQETGDLKPAGQPAKQSTL